MMTTFLPAALVSGLLFIGSAANGPPGPCGSPYLELENLTGYWSYRWGSDYKDFTEDEVRTFLKAKGLEESEITGIRIFSADAHEDYALTATRLFQNYLNGKPLVKLRCVVKLNGFVAFIMDPEDLEELFGKTYEEIGRLKPD